MPNMATYIVSKQSSPRTSEPNAAKHAKTSGTRVLLRVFIYDIGLTLTKFTPR